MKFENEESKGAGMSQISKKFRSIAGGKIGYWCQGCDTLHMVRVGML